MRTDEPKTDGQEDSVAVGKFRVSAGKPTREGAIRLARRRFLSSQRIDVGSIARDLDVDRTTLYRWFDGREGLVGEVLWSLSNDTLDYAIRRNRKKGTRRLLSATGTYVTTVGTSPAHRHFLHSQPELAAKVLYKKTFVDGLVGRYHALIGEELQTLRPDTDPLELAKAIVRIGHAFLYGYQLGVSEPNVDETMGVIRWVINAVSVEPVLD